MEEPMRKFAISAVGILVLAGIVTAGLRTRVLSPSVAVPRIWRLHPVPVHWRTTAGSAALKVMGGPLLYDHNAHVERPIASVTKVMTADLVLIHPRIYPLTRMISITRAEVLNDRRGLLKNDSEVALTLGQRVTVKDLLWALMLPSADDGAWVLADHYPGGSAAFIEAMNREAAQLGMQHTHYVDPDGVNHLGYSTASNLLKLITAGMAIPEFRRLVRTKTANTPFGPLTNLNQLLWTYPGAIGVKTGWTPWAGSCLAFAATRREHGHAITVEGVVLGEPSFGPMFQDVSQLLNTSFAAAKWETVMPKGAMVGRSVVRHGWLSRERPETFVLDRPLGAFATSSQARLEVRWRTLSWSGYRQGQVVGEARLDEAGWTGSWVPVIAERTVTVSWWQRL